MNLKIYLVVMVLGQQLAVNAQSKVRFENHNAVGLLSGTSSIAMQLQTVNGVNYKTFFLGAGIATDGYYSKSMPVFAEVRKYISGNKKNTPFVYLDAGSNISSEKDEKTTWSTTTYHSGLYYDLGIGYQWKTVKRFHVDASFGFSQKKYGYEQQFWGGIVGTESAPQTYEYRLQRFTMKLGLGF
jgi:hypothetical protein